MARTSDPIKKYVHVDLGYNYRMTNMQAAVGLSQLEVINNIMKKRNAQMLLYNRLLSKTRLFNFCLSYFNAIQHKLLGLNLFWNELCIFNDNAF